MKDFRQQQKPTVPLFSSRALAFSAAVFLLATMKLFKRGFQVQQMFYTLVVPS